MDEQARVRIDPVTIIGLGLILLPMLTMWHEIGGHAASCVALGGHVATIGAFYVDCTGLNGVPQRIVSCAGPGIDVVLSLIAWQIWQRARDDLARLAWWYVAMVKGFVAAGYFLFSGVTGYGDLGTDPGNGLAGLSDPLVWRIAFVAIGGVAYWRLYLAAVRGLNAMIGDTAETNPARRKVAHLFYATLGMDALLVGLLNPVGIVITIMSAAASSFGGNAGFISIGFAGQRGGIAKDFRIGRSWSILVVGMAISLGFAIVLGPSIHFR